MTHETAQVLPETWMPNLGTTPMEPFVPLWYAIFGLVRLVFSGPSKRRYRYNHLRNFRGGQEKKMPGLMGLWAL